MRIEKYTGQHELELLMRNPITSATTLIHYLAAQCFIPYDEFYIPHVHSGGISLTFTDLKVILSTPEDPQNLSVQLNFVHKFV